MAWLQFCGISSDEMHVKLLELSYPGRAEQECDTLKIPGRHSAVRQLKNQYKDIQKTAVLEFRENTDFRAVFAWLSGSGRLVTSDEPERYYNAFAVKPISSKRINGIYRSLTVQFTCEPFAYAADESPTDLSAAVSYTLLENNGTCYSEPLITFTLQQPETPDILPGDANQDGSVDAMDATLVLTAAASGDFSGWTEAQLAAADISGDGEIDANDATLILKKAAEDGTGSAQTPHDIFLYVNGAQMKISVPAVCAAQGLTVTIDSALQLVYYTDADGQRINILQHTYGDLPLLKSGDNYIRYSGDIAVLSILKRERWL